MLPGDPLSCRTGRIAPSRAATLPGGQVGVGLKCPLLMLRAAEQAGLPDV